MLLELQESDSSKIELLLKWAHEHNIHLSLLDEQDQQLFMRGVSLSDIELTNLILNSCQSGTISMAGAHKLITDNVGH